MSNVTDYLTMVANMQERQLPAGYISPARWLLDNGMDYDEHAEVPDWMMGEPQSCYMNAGQVALLHDVDEAYTYVEGFITCFGIPIAHAWVVDLEGRIYEVTLDDLDGIENYFGAPIDIETLREAALRTKVWGVLDPMTNRAMYKRDEVVA